MISALIVAAGQGVRMGAARRKQYLTIGGQPILAIALQPFIACKEISRIVVVVPGDDVDYCREHLALAGGLQAAIEWIAGGLRRQDSVRNGLKAIAGDSGIVLIHDGVRPFVTEGTITACIAGARRWGACIPVVAVTDTIKEVDADGVVCATLPRATLRAAQTPQAFDLALIREAHEAAIANGWQATDDASLVERLGREVYTIAGDANNFKITTPADLPKAESLYHRRGQNGT